MAGISLTELKEIAEKLPEKKDRDTFERCVGLNGKKEDIDYNQHL